jgi:ABC-2 type transport system ATP-binding protein
MRALLDLDGRGRRDHSLPVIRASGLSKYFGGKRALGPVSFDIGRGETVGFLGLNGAGKTTTLRILAGDLRPSAGTLEVDGVDAVREPLAVRRLVGFLPEHPPLYPDMTVADYLRFAGRVRGMAAERVSRRLAEVMELLALVSVGDELTRNLSEGYRQRVGVAQAIIHEPQLLVLDEPAHDLDPAQLVQMRDLLRRLGERHTILLSSHNLPEISQTCDRLLVLAEGRIIASGSEGDLAVGLERVRIEVEIRPAAAGADAAVAALKGLNGVIDATSAAGREEGAVTLTVDCARDQRAELNRALIERGHDVIRLERTRQQLEGTFLDLVKRGELGADRDHPAA